MSELMNAMPRYDAHKDSEVEWLGIIPRHWSTKRLKYISSIKTGEKDAVHRVDNGAYPFFIRSPLVQRIDAYSHDGEAVLTAGDGDIGKIFHYINGKFNYHQRVYKFSDFKGVSGKYLYYYLHHNLAEEVIKLSAKTTVDSLRLPFLQNFFVSLPPISEQIAIASFLDLKAEQIDLYVQIKEQQITLLKERKQLLIQNAVTRGLNPDTSMRDSGVEWIGDVPVHWAVMRLRYVLDERNERSKTGEEPLLMVSQVYGLVVRSDYHDKAEVAQSNAGNKIVYINDLVFNKLKAHLGVFFKSNIDFEGLVSPDYSVYKVKAYIYDLKYLEYLFRNPAYIGQFIIRATGIVEGLIRLYTGDLLNIAIPVPPKLEQADILSYLESESAKIDKATDLQQQQIDRLKEYKTTLINSAVTGKIRVPGAPDPVPTPAEQIP